MVLRYCIAVFTKLSTREKYHSTSLSCTAKCILAPATAAIMIKIKFARANNKILLHRCWKKFRIVVFAFVLLGAVGRNLVFLFHYTSSIAPAVTWSSQHETKRPHPNRKEEPPTSMPCSLVEERLSGGALLPPSALNELRRSISTTDPSCFLKHRDKFVERFLENRLLGGRYRRHLNLHIPKAAGTALCTLARANEFSTPIENCWFGSFCPIWCCCDSRQQVSCDDIAVMEPDFIMNENWLDHPMCDQHRTYSIVLRHPVERAISHVNNYQDLVARHLPRSGMAKGWRLNLLQSNYMTWALIAGDPRVWSALQEHQDLSMKNITPSTSKERTLVAAQIAPTAEHLEWAKETLRKFDYILLMRIIPEEHHHLNITAECLQNTLQLMGMEDMQTLQRDSENTFDASYREQYRDEAYKSLNRLDLALFEYSLQLIRMDCEFFEYASQHQASDSTSQHHREAG